MRQAAALFSHEDGLRIAEAVREAERLTAAEFVPAVATASSRYESAEDVVGGAVALAAAGVTWLAFDSLAAGLWGGAPWWSGALASGLAALVGFLAGAALGSALPGLRLALTSRRAKRAAVEARARLVFEDLRLFATTSGTGILLYASLQEGMAAVIGDRRVEEVLGSGGLDDARSIVEHGLNGGDIREALRLAVAAAAARLAGPFPRHDDDVNELPDEVVVVDEL